MPRILTLEEVKAAFNNLQESNVDESLAVRNMLNYALNGAIKSARVYVDSWPSCRALGVFFDISEYTETHKGTFSAIYAQNSEIFRDFLTFLMERERLDENSAIIVAEHQFLPILEQLFSKSSQRKIIHGPFANYLNQPSLAMTDKDGQDALDSKNPGEGYTVSSLTRKEAAEITKFWEYEGIPDTEAFFQFMADRFPQICIRNRQGEPVAWGLEYPVGEGAAIFTKPEYRRVGLTEVLTRVVLHRHYQVNPVTHYAGLEADNEASHQLMAKKHKSKLSTYKPIWYILGPFKGKC